MSKSLDTATVKEKSTYLAILSHSKELFWKYGIRKVTVEEICQEAGVSKMTFYRSFPNKMEVANRIIVDLCERNLQEYKNTMELKVPFSEKMKKVIEFKYKESKNISQDFLKDIYLMDEPDLKNILGKYRQRMLKDITRDFKEAQRNGWIRKDVKLDFILYMMEVINEKVMDERLLSLYGNIQEPIMELTNFFFYGILTPASNCHD